MIPAVRRWLLAMEARVQSRVISYNDRGGRSCSGAGFSPSFFCAIAITRQDIIKSSVLKLAASPLTRHLADYRARKLVNK
jgi:hypothetical protein